MTTGRGLCFWHPVGEARDAAKYPTMYRTPPPQRITGPKRSTVWQLRNLSREKETLPGGTLAE